MPIPPGSRIGPFEILSSLGAGGMGEVYRARDPRLQRDVAIKVLPASVATDADRLRRFETEARAVAALNHPNVLTIYEVSTHDGHPFLATELLEGETLRARLDTGALPASKAIDYARQTATGLAAAHARGIAHRDIKPENLFVTADGRIKILDFGLAKSVEPSAAADLDTRLQSATSVGTVVGTVGYMSPEQVRAAPVDHRTDIFSLGVVLYEMLAGRRPFGGESSVHTMHAILTDDPPDVSTPQRPLPPTVSQVVRHCLEKNPEERFQSARDLSFALQALSGSAPSVSSRAALDAAAPDRRDGTRARRPWLAVALVALAALAVGLAAGVSFPRRPSIDLDTYRFTPFAVDPGANKLPTWSPDGRSLAYVSGSTLLVRSLDADSPTTVAREIVGSVASIFWFPDGARLGYLVTNVGVYAVSLAGGAPELLQRGLIDAAALSPDGNTLALWTVHNIGGQGTSALWFASPITAEPKKYERAFVDSPTVNPNFLAWSPDGRRLAYSGWPGNASVWIMPVGSDGVGPAVRAFPDDVWLSPPRITWMPDNRSLVLTEGLISKRPGLWIGNADTGAITRITAGVEIVDYPSVSPDGRRIAYSSASWNFDLVALPLDGQSAVDVLATTRQEFGGVYTGSESIVYITDRSGEEEIRIRRLADGTERVIAAPRNVPITPPAFASVFPSPDATRILFTCWDGKGMSAWVAPMGGPPVRIGGAAEIWGATWSPDGREIASVEMNGRQAQLVRRRIGSSEPPVVVKNANAHAATLPQWSPTGEWIAYRSTDGLTIVKPDGQQRQVLAPYRPPALAWSRDGRTLYAILLGNNINSLQAFDVTTGRGRMLRQFAAGSTPAGPVTPSLRLAVSPDGRSLLTSVLRHRSDIWLLER